MGNTKSWSLPRSTSCYLAMASLVAALMFVPLLHGQQPKRPPKGANVQAGEKAKLKPAISQAALATELALQGERRRSPIMLLAAAELLGNLKESPRKLDVTKQGPPAGPPSGKAPVELDLHECVEKARQYAQDDKALLAYIEDRIEQLSSRGLVSSQGRDKESVDLAGTTFKVLDADVVGPGSTLLFENVIFEGDEPAVVVVIGDGDGDLDLWVYDGNTKGLIGRDTDGSSRCVVDWETRYEGPFTIRVANVGRVAERYVLLVNW